MHKFIDYTGFAGDGFLVIDQAESKITINPDGSKRRTNFWNCKCECGFLFIRSATSILKNKKCIACTNSEMSRDRITNRPNHKRLKTIWSRMKDRCYNKKHVSYKYYGERGITISSEWLNSFEVFYNWALQNGYEYSLTLDRKNTFGNYGANNCRWATRKEQQANRRDSVKREFNGELLNGSAIADITGKSYMNEYLKTRRLNKKSA